MQAFNHSLTNVSMNSPYYREWQPPLLLMSAYPIMGCSPENLLRLFAVWPVGRKSRARGPCTSKRCLKDIWTGTRFYIGKISRIESV